MRIRAMIRSISWIRGGNAFWDWFVGQEQSDEANYQAAHSSSRQLEYARNSDSADAVIARAFSVDDDLLEDTEHSLDRVGKSRGQRFRDDLRNFLPELMGLRFGGPSKPHVPSGMTSPVSAGALEADVAATYRSSSYTASITGAPTTPYRVYGGKAGQLGPYWTRTKPSGPVQATMDSALNPAWGNSATTITVPKGVTICEGVAASQPITTGSRAVVGYLQGGGNQVYIPRVDRKWLR